MKWSQSSIVSSHHNFKFLQTVMEAGSAPISYWFAPIQLSLFQHIKWRKTHLCPTNATVSPGSMLSVKPLSTWGKGWSQWISRTLTPVRDARHHGNQESISCQVSSSILTPFWSIRECGKRRNDFLTRRQSYLLLCPSSSDIGSGRSWTRLGPSHWMGSFRHRSTRRCGEPGSGRGLWKWMCTTKWHKNWVKKMAGPIRGRHLWRGGGARSGSGQMWLLHGSDEKGVA